MTSIRTIDVIFEKPDLHRSFTPMCHSHRSSPLTSAQTFVFPKEHICYTGLTRGGTWILIPPAASRPVRCLDRTSIAMRHAPCGIQAIASLNRARWGDNVYIPVHKCCIPPEQYPGKSSPNTGLNQTLTAMHPSPIVPTIQPTEFCGSL